MVCFQETVSNFLVSLKFLHLVDKQWNCQSWWPSYDCCAKIQPLISANQIFWIIILHVSSWWKFCWNKEFYATDAAASDMVVCTYLDEQRIVKFWKEMCFSILPWIVLNSYIIYKENLTPGMKWIAWLGFCGRVCTWQKYCWAIRYRRYLGHWKYVLQEANK